MDNEKLVSLMNDSRLINAADFLIFPLIEKMITDRISLACSEFAGGKKEFIADIAYIYGLKEIQNKLKNKQVQGNKAHMELNKE